jgi:hypothetical protein
MVGKRGLIVFGVLFLMVFVFISSVGVVSANLADDISVGTKGFITGLFDGISEIFGNVNPEELTRIFFFVLVLMIVYSVSEVFSRRWYINWLFSGIVSILAVFFLPNDLIITLRDAYGALGAAMLTIIPFLIVLVFSVKHKSVGIARASWVIFSIYYFALLIYEWINSGWQAENVFYVAGILAGLAFIFLMKPIREAVWKGKLAGLEEEANKVVARGGLLHRIQKKEFEGYTDGAGI